MNYFTPIMIDNRKLYFNRYTFQHTAENLKRLEQGKAPIGVDKKPVTLHHIGRSHTSNLATLTDTFHSRHSDKIHNLPPSNGLKVNRKAFKGEKKRIWKAVGQWLKWGLL